MILEPLGFSRLFSQYLKKFTWPKESIETCVSLASLRLQYVHFLAWLTEGWFSEIKRILRHPSVMGESPGRTKAEKEHEKPTSWV